MNSAINSCLLLALVNSFALQVDARVPDCERGWQRYSCVVDCPWGYRVAGRSCHPGAGTCCKVSKANPYSSLPIETLRGFTGMRSGEGRADPPPAPRRFYRKELTRTQRKLKPVDRPNPFLNNLFKNLRKKYKVLPGQKSAKYCKEYTKLSKEYSYAQPLLPEVWPLKIEMDNCAPRFTPLIVGGKNASDGEFPHMAALGYKRIDDIDYLCGGTLISENFVLTAAHCTSTKWGPPVVVQLGTSVLYSKRGVEMKVKDIILHPEYNPPSCYHDIALLRLEDGLQMSANVRPACLPTLETKAQFPGSVAIATGWGKLGFGRDSSFNLRKVSLKVIDQDKCSQYYASDVKTPSLQDGITTDLICASGYEDIYHDTCQGDSGGPLQSILPGSECMLQVVGVTSFGKTCGTGVPGVYTRVAPYVPWIEKIIWA